MRTIMKAATISAILLLLGCIMEAVKGVEGFMRNIPYLMLSSNDGTKSGTVYIEFTKYYDFKWTINPTIGSSTEGLTAIQPFQVTNLTMGHKNKKLDKGIDLGNCTASSRSTSEFGALVCYDDDSLPNLVVFGQDEVLITQKLRVPFGCPTKSKIECKSIIMEETYTLFFVVCSAKNSSSSLGFAIFTFSLIDDNPASLFSDSLCVSVTLESTQMPWGFTAALNHFHRHEDEETKALTFNTSIVVGAIGSAEDPVYENLHKVNFLLKVEPGKVAMVWNKTVTKKITDVTKLQLPVKILQMRGSISNKFSTLYDGSNLILQTYLENDSVQQRDVFFIWVNETNFVMKKQVSLNRYTSSVLHLDEHHFIVLDYSCFGTSCISNVTVIDLYSLYTENLDVGSAVTYEKMTMEFRTNVSQPSLSELADGRNEFKSNFRIYSTDNMMALMLDLNKDQYLAVIDIRAMSASIITLTGQNYTIPAIFATAEEPTVAISHMDSEGRHFIQRISGFRCYIGVQKGAQSYNYTAFIEYTKADETSQKVRDTFPVSGMWIDDVGKFILIYPDVFRQCFDYYFDMTYNIYLPWSNIRGTDVELISSKTREGLQILSNKHIEQNILVDSLSSPPENYFIKDDVLVLFEKHPAEDRRASYAIIKIFKEVTRLGNDLYYRLVTNYTLSPPPGTYLNLNNTFLRSVEVFYENILLLTQVMVVSHNVPIIRQHLISFFGPNYLKGTFSIESKSTLPAFSIQPNDESTCYLILCSTPTFGSKFLTVYVINMENMNNSNLIRDFGPLSLVQPSFCPIDVFQDLIDNQYLIIISRCGDDWAYTMRLDLRQLIIAEYQRERLINKGSDDGIVCASSQMTVAISDNSLTGYTFLPGKSVYNKYEFFMSDISNLKNAYTKCFPNLDMFVVGQDSIQYYTVYIYSTKRAIEADKRLIQRIRIFEPVSNLTVTTSASTMYLHYTIVNSSIMKRVVVSIEKGNIFAQINSTEEMNQTINIQARMPFRNIGGVTSDGFMCFNFEKPMYNAKASSYPDLSFHVSELEGEDIDNVINFTGPIYSLDITVIDPENSTNAPAIIDMMPVALASIRAPIFSYFDILTLGNEVFVGIVNYPYGFDICAIEVKLLQDPIVSSFSSIEAHEAVLHVIGDYMYLFVQGRNIGDTSSRIMTFRASFSDFIFVRTGDLN